MCEKKQMPLADGSKATEEFLKQEYKQAKATTIILDSSNQKWLDQYHHASELLKQVEAEKKEAANNIKLLMGEHEVAYIGKTEIHWKTIHKTDLDTKRLKMEDTLLYKKYSRESDNRRFEIK